MALRIRSKFPRPRLTEAIQAAASVQHVGFGIVLKDQAFLMKYARHHAYTYTVDNSLTLGEDQAFREYKRALWAARTDPLWSCFVCTNFGPTRPYRTRKSWLARRMRIAYSEALNKRGYAKNGTMLDGKSTGEDVVGTVIFMARETMMTMKTADVQVQMDMAIDKILNLSSKSCNKSHEKVTKPPLPIKTPAKKQLLNADKKKPKKVSNTSSGTKTLVLEHMGAVLEDHMPELKRRAVWKDAEAPASTITSSSKLLTSSQSKTNNVHKGNLAKVGGKRKEDPSSEITSSGTPMVKWSSFASPSNVKR